MSDLSNPPSRWTHPVTMEWDITVESVGERCIHLIVNYAAAAAPSTNDLPSVYTHQEEYA